MLTIKNRRGNNLVFVLVIGGALLVAGCKPPGARALLDGKRLIDQGKYAAAVERLKVATSLLGTNAHAWNYLGLAYHGAGQTTNAIQAYQKALMLNHDLVEARFNLGCVLLDQNKPDKLDAAKAEFTAYTLRRPNSIVGWLKLGAAQLRARELAAGEKSFNEALRANAQSPEAWNGLGLVQLQRNRARDAAQSFNAALKHQPNYGPALLNLAIVSQQHLNDHRLALQKYREYLTLKPTPANADLVRAAVRVLEQELNPPAKPPASNFIAQVSRPANVPVVPTNNPPRPAVAVAPKTETPVEQAKPPSPTLPKPSPPTNPPAPVEMVKVSDELVIKPAQDVSPEPAAARPPAVESAVDPPLIPAPVTRPKTAKRGFFDRINPVNLFRRDSKPAASPTPLPTATISSPPDSPKTVASNAIPESTAKGPASPAPTARFTYRAPAKPEPGNRADAERSFAQGVQAERQGRLREALAAFRAATKSDPSFFKAYYNLGWTAYELGDWEQALAAYEIALAIEPDSLDTRYNFALTLRQAEYPQDAAEQLERLLTKYPDEARAHFLLGNLYAQQLRQPQLARPHYLKVLAAEPRHPQATQIRYWLAANPG